MLDAAVRDQSVHKNYTYGTHRSRDPEETLHAISAHFPTMGITRIADVTGLDRIGIAVCMAVRPNSKSLSVSQGKGLTLMLAKVSAAMESVESYHGENITLPVITQSYREFARSEEACDPQTLNLHTVSVYNDDLPIPWIEGFDLLQEHSIWVPYHLVDMAYLHTPARKPVFDMSSNGLASGNHILEAISHAICEVIERDATALWNLRNISLEEDRTYLKQDSIDSPTCLDLLNKIKKAGLAVNISVQTSDVGIPAFECNLADLEPDNPLLAPVSYRGNGSHLSKEIALTRAITEAIQSRLTYIAGSRDDMYRADYSMASASIYHSKKKGYHAKIQAAVDFREIPSLETDSFEGDVATQLALLKKVGIEQVVTVDLTQPDIGIPVARIIIPGMEFSHKPGFTKRLGQRAKAYLMKTQLLNFVEESAAR